MKLHSKFKLWYIVAISWITISPFNLYYSTAGVRPLCVHLAVWVLNSCWDYHRAHVPEPSWTFRSIYTFLRLATSCWIRWKSFLNWGISFPPLASECDLLSLPRRKFQLSGTNIKLQTLRILSPKFPQLRGLDVSDCDWFDINCHLAEDFAKFLCERDDEGSQLFPNLDSLWQIHGSMKSEDLSYIVQHRDGIENFRVLNVAPPFHHQIADAKVLSDLHSSLLAK